MAKVRVTAADPSLPHQIKLRLDSQDNTVTLVSCNCSHEPFGRVSTGSGDVWSIYNKGKHDDSVEVFVPGKTTWKVYEVE